MTIDSRLKNTRLFRVRSWAEHNFELKTVDGKTLGVMIFMPINSLGEVDAVVLKVSLYNAARFEFSNSYMNSMVWGTSKIFTVTEHRTSPMAGRLTQMNFFAFLP